MSKIFSRSVRCVSYIDYKTGVEARVESSDRDDMNVFVFDKSKEVSDKFIEYKDKSIKQEEMIVDLNRFDSIIRKYKRMTRDFEKNRAR